MQIENEVFHKIYFKKMCYSMSPQSYCIKLPYLGYLVNAFRLLHLQLQYFITNQQPCFFLFF